MPLVTIGIREQTQSARARFGFRLHRINHRGHRFASHALALTHFEIGSPLLQRMKGRLCFVLDVRERCKHSFNHRVRLFKGFFIATRVRAAAALIVVNAAFLAIAFIPTMFTRGLGLGWQ
jgi:hypothetical protein